MGKADDVHPVYRDDDIEAATNSDPTKVTTQEVTEVTKPLSLAFSNVSRHSITAEEQQEPVKKPFSWRAAFFRRQDKAGQPLFTDEKKAGASNVTMVGSDDASCEVEDLETHWHEISEESKRALAKDWNPKRQLFGLLKDTLVDWLVTVVFLIALWGEVYGMSRKAVMTSRDKNVHNFLNLSISLFLGIAIGNGLKNMAGRLRWWFISLKRRSVAEIQLILNIESMTESIKLGKRVPGLIPLVGLWVLLFFAGQIAVACFGLFLTVDSKTNMALVQNGTVMVPDMSKVPTNANTRTASEEDIYAQMWQAQQLGNLGLSFFSTDMSENPIPPPRTLFDSFSTSYTTFASWGASRDEHSEDYWQYVFLDVNPHATNDDFVPGVKAEDNWSVSVYTNRSVITNATCSSWFVSKCGAGDDCGGKGNETIEIVVDGDGTTMEIFPPAFLGVDQTTFWTDADADIGACGPGCSRVFAWETSAERPWYYECNVTVSDMINGTLPEHTISADLRNIAGAAIALQGFTYFDDGTQYQSYPAQTYWGYPLQGDDTYMAMNIANYAVNVIAAAAMMAPGLEVVGEQPQKGSALSVSWNRFYIVFGLIAGMQLVLGILSALAANLVFVKDGSPLALARTLRPLVDRLGAAGNAADGDAIARALDSAEGAKIVYSVRHPERGSRHHLDLGVQRRLRAFPRGNYD